MAQLGLQTITCAIASKPHRDYLSGRGQLNSLYPQNVLNNLQDMTFNKGVFVLTNSELTKQRVKSYESGTAGLQQLPQVIAALNVISMSDSERAAVNNASTRAQKAEVYNKLISQYERKYAVMGPLQTHTASFNNKFESRTVPVNYAGTQSISNTSMETMPAMQPFMLTFPRVNEELHAVGFTVPHNEKTGRDMVIPITTPFTAGNLLKKIREDGKDDSNVNSLSDEQLMAVLSYFAAYARMVRGCFVQMTPPGHMGQVILNPFA